MRVITVGETSNLACAFIKKREWLGVCDPFKLRIGVTLRLLFDRSQSDAPIIGFRFDNTYRLHVCKKDIVGGSNVCLILTNSDAEPCAKIDGVLVLNIPTRRSETLIDAVSGNLFWVLVYINCHD